ncbi:MAG: GTP cyclohydrolase I FolE [Microbacteriaceae bacterium]|nr:GTP cyclohydrolase I FolE [Microbacteriaceae bacterium]
MAGAAPGADRADERSGPDRIRTEIAVRELLAAWGIAPDDPRTGRTAERVADAAAELLAGEGVDPVPALRDGRIPAPDGDLVLVRNIRFRSMCEHHLLPFDGWIQLAYLPGDWIVGFGRLHDLVETCASRLSLQERLGEQLVDALMLGLGARGALAVVEARQGCVADRGPRQADSDAVSVAARGALVDSAARAEAFRLIALAAVADRG